MAKGVRDLFIWATRFALVVLLPEGVLRVLRENEEGEIYVEKNATVSEIPLGDENERQINGIRFYVCQ